MWVCADSTTLSHEELVTAHTGKIDRGMLTCTNIKASTTTKPTRLSSNHLTHAQEGTLGYRPKLKHDTIPKLDLAETIHNIAWSYCFSKLENLLSLS
jgi:hypothetical protein